MSHSPPKSGQKKRILFVITKSNWGGAQKYVYDLATTLPREQFEVGVALGGTGQKGTEAGRLAHKLEEAGVNTFFVRSFTRDINWFGEFAPLFELITLFRKLRPDVVHLSSSKAGGIGALAARIARVPNIIFTVHGLPHYEDRNPLAKAMIWLATWATLLLSKQVIVVSRDNEKSARRFPFCRGKVTLIHNGIEVPNFVSRQDARTHLSLPQDVFVIGGNGELTRNKGWQYLIDASKLLRDRKHDFRVCVMSSGEDKEKLETQVRSHNLHEHISFVGFVTDGARYYRAFDAFVLPSVKEGLPYVLLEAGHAPLPVVASDIPGIDDIINHDEHGLLFTAKNPHELADHLAHLLENSETRERLRITLQTRIQAEFSQEKMIEKTIALYQS